MQIAPTSVEVAVPETKIAVKVVPEVAVEELSLCKCMVPLQDLVPLKLEELPVRIQTQPIKYQLVVSLVKGLTVLEVAEVVDLCTLKI